MNKLVILIGSALAIFSVYLIKTKNTKNRKNLKNRKNCQKLSKNSKNVQKTVKNGKNREKREKIRKKLSSLSISNLGNNCFLNALIQSLRSCPAFVERISRKNGLSDFDQILFNFVCLEKNFSAQFISYFSRLFPFAFFEQQDSHEMFFKILEADHDLKSPFKIETIEKDTCQKCGHKFRSKELENFCISLSFSNDGRNSFFIKKFQSNENLNEEVNLESLLNFYFENIFNDFICYNCISRGKYSKIQRKINSIKKNKSLPSEEIKLKLNFLEKSKEKIRMNFNTSFQKEKYQTVSTITTIKNRPKIFCVHINRKLRLNKCETFLNFGSQINLSGVYEYFGEENNDQNIEQSNSQNNDQKIEQNNGQNNAQNNGENSIYSLKAIIEHQGEFSEGHFLAYRRFEGEWLRCSDMDIEVVSEDEVLNAQAYMLFYCLDN